MSTARGFIGAGEVFLNRKVSGVAQGLTGPFYADKFEITPKLKSLPLISRARADYGQTVLTVSVHEPYEFSIDLTESSREAMALALMGSSAATSQTAGTLTAEVMVAKLGVWVPLTKGSLTGTQTVTNSGATVTYTLGTDYEVNTQMGWIKALAGGAITADQSLKVTTTYGAFTGVKISGAGTTEVFAEIIFVGANLVDKSPCIVTVREGVIASDAAYNFLNSEFNMTALTGTMRTPTGATAPFTVDLLSA